MTVLTAGYAVAYWEPTPCYHDAYSVGTPFGAFGVRVWQTHCKSMFSLFVWTFLSGM